MLPNIFLYNIYKNTSCKFDSPKHLSLEWVFRQQEDKKNARYINISLHRATWYIYLDFNHHIIKYTKYISRYAYIKNPRFVMYGCVRYFFARVCVLFCFKNIIHSVCILKFVIYNTVSFY